MPEPPEEDGPDANGPGPTEDDEEQEHGRLAAVLAARRETLARLEERGVPAFALNFAKDTDAADILREFDGLQAEEETDRVKRVAGRVVLLRRHGGVAFVVIRD